MPKMTIMVTYLHASAAKNIFIIIVEHFSFHVDCY